MEFKFHSCVILLACLILQATPVTAATGNTDVTGTVPLVTSEVSASNIGYYSATISWKTNGNATSQVFYDTSSHDSINDYAHHTDEYAALVSEHSLPLTGLYSGTTYHFRVRSAIPGTEFIAISGDYTFTTLTPSYIDGGGGGWWLPPATTATTATTNPDTTTSAISTISASAGCLLPIKSIG